MPPTVFLHPQDARAVAQGHPWVYRQAVAERPSSLKAGQVVVVAGPGRPFLGRGIWDPGSSVAVRVWTREEEARIDSDLIRVRVREAERLRQALGIPVRTTAWRVVNAEGDGLPGVLVDRFGDWLAITLQTGALASWADTIAGAVAAQVPARGVYLRGDDASRLVAGEPCPDEFEVREPAVRALVSLAAPGKPGLFPDMREARVVLAQVAPKRRVLNLFAHTGAFSACAAAAGASEVVSVDLSANYLAAARRNVELNAPGFAAHRTVTGDALDALAGFAREGRRFDVVVCDPPTFSSSKKGGAFSVRDHYRPLVRATLRVLEPGGIAFFATNFRGVTREQFLRLLHDGAEMQAVDLRVMTVLGQPADFPVPPMLPEAAYLHVAVCAPQVR